MSTKEKKRDTKQNEKTILDIQKSNELSDRSRYNLDLVNGWISSADSKIGTFGTVFAVVAAVFVYVADMIFSYVDNSVLVNPILLTWSTFFAVSSFLALVVAIILCLVALRPSLKSKFSRKFKKISYFSIFYEDIARIESADEYIRIAKESTRDKFTDEVMREIYFNSRICSNKMHLFKNAFIASILSIIFYVSWILFYVLAY